MPNAPAPWGESPPHIREQVALRDAAIAALAAEQRWVELTVGQVDDLLSMVVDRLASVEGKIDEHDAADELRGRRVELIVLKGMLLLGRDDPGAPTGPTAQGGATQ